MTPEACRKCPDGATMEERIRVQERRLSELTLDRRELLAEVDRLREAATKASAELRHAIRVCNASGHTQWGLIDRAVRLLESATTLEPTP